VQLKTIQQVRKDLRCWGLFWSQKKLGSGYARTSVTAKICETLKTEVYTSSDLHLFNSSADSIYIPPHIERIGDAINKLSFGCRKAVNDKYINLNECSDFYIREAENSLIPLLS